MSVKKNLLKNGIATGIQKGVTILEQLILVPFFITAWGVAFYGEWITLTVIPAMLAYANFGFGSGASSIFVLRYAAGELQGASDAARSGYYLITLTFIGCVVFGAVTLLVLEYFHVLDKSLIPKNDAVWAVSLLMLARSVDFYQQLAEGFFIAARKASVSMHLLSAYAALKLICGILVLLAGGGIIVFTVLQLAVSILFNIVYYLVSTKLLPVQSAFPGKRKKTDLKEIVNKGLGYLLSPIWQSIYFQGTTFVVRLTLGAEAVAIFNTVRTVSRTANQGYSMVNSTIFPEIQFEIGAGRWDRARRIFRAALFLSVVMAVAGIILLFFFGEWFYMIWTRNALHPPAAVWNVFLIGIGLNALWWTSAVVFRACNKPYALSVIGFISSIIAVAGSYFLSLSYGLTGAAIGSLFLEIIMAICILPISFKLLGQSISGFFTDLWKDAFSFKTIVRS